MRKMNHLPAPDGRGRRLGIVTARFHPEITQAMRGDALKRARELGAEVIVEAEVSGSYDLSLVMRDVLQRADVDGAVALGAIVTGETHHDEAIANALFYALTRVALETKKPVGLGVTGPGQTYAQAQARIDRAGAAVDAVLLQLGARHAIKQGRVVAHR